MKKLSRPICAVIIACILLLMYSNVSYAADEEDPGGKCYIAPPIIDLQYNK